MTFPFMIPVTNAVDATALLCVLLAQMYLEALPSATMYEKSYMHRDLVTHSLFTSCGTDFLVTASADGHVKFWKKMPEGDGKLPICHAFYL